MQAALENFSIGSSVTATAFAVGYSGMSSFIAEFKALFGSTPAQICEPASKSCLQMW
ncbi:helix-turn-helix domain-containing protein [Burkholderia cepacia]|uniref:helix-turn-helix domain-containing protein n=1 Tax=Burkholderia cepacia TaxID=292 RepID=UPI0011B5E2E2|nr:helix-turn-helix domain-containing protein [Burkholderia cepacia]MDN7894242.1 helix-turn-helix domain-containing protein [Burkholderia cepacia]